MFRGFNGSFSSMEIIGGVDCSNETPDLFVKGGARIDKSLSVTGNINIKKNMTIDKDLIVFGNVIFPKNGNKFTTIEPILEPLSQRIVESNIDTKIIKNKMLWQNSIEIGNCDTGAHSLDSIAIGKSALAPSSFSLALGTNTNASGDYSISIGQSSNASSEGAISLGVTAKSSGAFSCALGTGATASSKYSIAIGGGGLHFPAASASGDISTAIGLFSKAQQQGSVAIGSGSVSISQYAIAIGGAFAGGSKSISIGDGANTSAGGFTTALGSSSKAFGPYSSSFGSRSKAYDGGTVVGSSSLALDNCVAVGYGTIAGTIAGDIHSIAVGSQSIAANAHSIAIGSHSKSYNAGTSIGHSSLACVNCVAIGFGSTALQYGAIAIGDISNAANSNSIGIGTGCESANINSISIGNLSSATAMNSVSIGHLATSSTPNSFQFGQQINSGKGALFRFRSQTLGNEAWIGGGLTGCAIDNLGNLIRGTVSTPLSFLFFVSQNGNDSLGNGSSGNPYLTIQKAIDVAHAIYLDMTYLPMTLVVWVMPGLYNQNCILKPGVCVKGLGINITQIRGDWTLDDSQLNKTECDVKCGWADIELIGNINVDFGCNEGTIFAHDVKFSGDVSINSHSLTNKFTFFGGEHVSTITLNGMVSELRNVISYGDISCHYSENGGNTLEHSGEIRGKLSIYAMSGQFVCTLTGQVHSNSISLFGVNALIISQARLLASSIYYHGGASYSQITMINSLFGYTPGNISNWNNIQPTSLANVLDRIAAKIGPI